MSKKCIYFSSLFYSYIVFGSVVICFRCAVLSGIECFYLRKNISNFAEATREKRFTTMTPLDMSRDVTCHSLWRHNCFSNSLQFELIYFISIWTSQNLLKIRAFLCIRKRNELFDHPSYVTSLFTGWRLVLRRWQRLLLVNNKTVWKWKKMRKSALEWWSSVLWGIVGFMVANCFLRLRWRIAIKRNFLP